MTRLLPRTFWLFLIAVLVLFDTSALQFGLQAGIDHSGGAAAAMVMTQAEPTGRTTDQLDIAANRVDDLGSTATIFRSSEDEWIDAFYRNALSTRVMAAAGYKVR